MRLKKNNNKNKNSKDRWLKEEKESFRKKIIIRAFSKMGKTGG